MSFGPVGMNSGMDINAMVGKIVDAERAPKQQRIYNEQIKIESSVSAYGRLRESLDTMKNLMASFRHENAFSARKVDTSDDAVVSATATTKAIAGRYSVDVLQLAQSHKVASDVFDRNEKFDEGKLRIAMGKRSFEVDVKQNSTLSDVVRGINSSSDNPGVRSSIINDVNGPRLIVASDHSGQENGVSMSVETTAPNNALKRLEYKTLEQRVSDLEKARATAQELLSPLTPQEQLVADRIAQRNIDAAKIVDKEIADATKQAASIVDPNAVKDVTPTNPISEKALAAAAKAGQTANQYIKPEDRIPGWTETASGTLLDSYWEPEPELDDKAREKSSEVPGWNNTASGTLTDSYVTPKEAQAALDQKLAAEQAVIAAAHQDEMDHIDAALAGGDMDDAQAKHAKMALLAPEQRDYLQRIEQAQNDLKMAQTSFDTYRGMSQVQAAQDSKVLLDGVAQLSSNNNVIEDAIDGVDLTLKGRTQPGKEASEIDIEYDRQGVREDIEQFVSAYNQFYQLSKELAAHDPVTGQAGPLAGDSIMRSADNKLRAVFSQSVEPAPQDLKSLTEFGITTTRQGALEINYEMLDRQINLNFNKLEDFFGGNKGFAKKVEDAIHGVTGSQGSLRTREQSLVERNYRLQDDQVKLDRRMEGLEDRTHAKFSAMQDSTSNMQAQLAGMMSALSR